MSTYGWIGAALAATFLLLFGLVEWLEVEPLRDPSALLASGGWSAALLGVGLLVADVLIPVPASLVMIANGAAYGILAGAALSLLGSVGATGLGFWLGRRGGAWLDRLVSEPERRRGDALLQRWGMLAVVVTRPIPIMAETVAILAGTSPMSWARLGAAAVAGSVPASLLLATTGATSMQLDDSLLVFGLVLAVAGLVWLGGRALGRRLPGAERPDPDPDRPA